MPACSQGRAVAQEATGADRPAFVEDEPGHERSVALFVPGEEPGPHPLLLPEVATNVSWHARARRSAANHGLRRLVCEWFAGGKAP